MKIEQQKQEFRPVTIVLESEEEVNFMKEILHGAFTGKCVDSGPCEWADDAHHMLCKTTT